MSNFVENKKIAKMKNILFIMMMCVAIMANAQSWSKDLEKKAKKGDVASQVAVANAYASGDGVKIDLNKAAKWYYEAAKQGNNEAKQKLYSFYSKELEKFAKEGDAQAQFEVGEDYYYGDRDLTPNVAKAATWYYMATLQGHAQAKERLYSYYSKELEGLAEKGQMEAQVAIGDHYLYARRVRKSTSDAAKWYNRAAFQGSEKAKKQLFSFYNEELKKHAENGYAEAQYALGQCFQYGYEVDPSYSEAMKWYMKGAAQGHKESDEALYGFYNKELERRAKQGETKAQYRLGECYLNGIGVEKNRTTAESWMKKGFADQKVRLMCLGNSINGQLNEMSECKMSFYKATLSGIYDGENIVNAQLSMRDNSGKKYTFSGTVNVRDAEILEENFQQSTGAGSIKYTQTITLKNGGEFVLEGPEGFKYRLIDDMQLTIVSSRGYSYFLGEINLSEINSCEQVLSYPLTITYNVTKSYDVCNEIGGVVLPSDLKRNVKVIEERVFITPGKKDLNKDKLYALKETKCVLNDKSEMIISQLDDNTIKEITIINDAKNIEIRWDVIMSVGQFERQIEGETLVSISNRELKLSRGDLYVGSYKKLSLEDFLQMISWKETDFVISRFVDEYSNGDYYYANGGTERLINGKLESVIIAEARQARQAEEANQAEVLKGERGFLYKKYYMDHVDMLYEYKICEGMNDALLTDFQKAYPDKAEFSFGYGEVYISFANGSKYKYRVKEDNTICEVEEVY